MILTIDIENTFTIIGVFDGDKLLFKETVPTDKVTTDFKVASDLEFAFAIHDLTFDDVTEVAICSVVPSVTATYERAIVRFMDITPIVAGPGVKTGLKIRIDDPSQLGTDLAVSAAISVKEYKLPQIIIGLGTANTFSLIDENGFFCGTSIGPGIKTGLDALADYTSQLPYTSVEKPKKVIGTNTFESLQSGSVYYCASAIDGMIDRIEEEYGRSCNLIITGDYSAAIAPFCKHKMTVDNNLLLKGLKYICTKNTK